MSDIERRLNPEQTNLVREYRPEDEQQIEDCIVVLQDFEKSIEPDRNEGKDVAKRYLHDLLSQVQEKGGKIFVVEVENKVAGFISIWFESNPTEYVTTLKDYA